MSRVEGHSALKHEESSGWSMDDESERGLVEAKKTMTETGTEKNRVVREVQIINKMGLHARPAMQFVDLANKFTSHITVSKKAQCVNAKSIMELLLLAATAGTVLTIQADGDDAEKAVDALVNLVANKFGEE
jgi:phosphocarrier protein